MNKLDELKQKIENFQAKTAAKEEIKAFVILVLQVLKKSKDEFSQLTEENIQTIKDKIALIEENSKKWDNTLDSKINTTTGQFDAKLALLKDLIEEVKTLKPKDGDDGISPLPEEIVPLVLEQIKLPEYKETVLDDGQQIADKLNQFDEIVDPKVIKGLVKKISDISSNIAHGIAGSSTTFVNGKLAKNINFTGATVSHNGDNANVAITGGSGSGTWGSITGTLSAQTDLQSALDAKQGDITLTTTGTSGAATLVGDTLNIPQYAASITGSDTQVLFFDGANNPAGDAGMTYVKATDTLTLAGALVSPTIVGGTGTTSDLNLKTTSGVGTTGADMHFLVGNNGGTEAMTILNSGNVGIGTNAPTSKLDVRGVVKATYTTDNVDQNSFKTFPTTSDRNDANFTIGFTFYPATDMEVSQLGRYYYAGNSQNHDVGIWEKATGTLVASGTVLAASASDANDFKYVSITPVTLSSSKEYVIAAQEFAGGDLWKNQWNSTGYFNPNVKRTGSAYIASASFVIPTTFQVSNSVYNALNFIFVPEAVPQVNALYDTDNYLSMLMSSSGVGAFVSSDADETIGIVNPLALGGGVVPTGYQVNVAGNMNLVGSSDGVIKTTNAAGTSLLIGGSSASGSIPTISSRGGYVLLDSGGADVLLNYDNKTKNVSIAGIISGTKLGVTITSSTLVGQIIRGAASQTADLLQFQNNSATVLSRITANGWFNSPGSSRVNSNVTSTDTTFAAITGLTATLVAGRKYTGTMTLYCDDSTAADGIKFDFDGGTATMTSFQAAISSNVQGATLGTTVSTALATDLTATAMNGTGVNCIVISFAFVVNAAGTFIPRMAQNADTGGTATVYANSNMIINDVI